MWKPWNENLKADIHPSNFKISWKLIALLLLFIQAIHWPISSFIEIPWSFALASINGLQKNIHVKHGATQMTWKVIFKTPYWNKFIVKSSCDEERNSSSKEHELTFKLKMNINKAGFFLLPIKEITIICDVDDRFCFNDVIEPSP